MRPFLQKLLTASLLVAILPAPLFAGAAARAQSQPDGAGEEKTWQGRWGRRPSKEGDDWKLAEEKPRIDDAYTARHLSEALEHYQAEEYDEANATLDELRPWALNDFEKARALQFRAYIAAAQGDSAKARSYLEDALALGSLADDEQADARFQIAQLYLGDEDWPQAIANLHKWFAMVDEPSPQAYYMLALAYFQMEDYDQALPAARKCLELAGDEPQETWLQLLLALRLQRTEYAEALPLLQMLVRRFPSKRYWLTLSTVYASMEDYTDALVPLQLAHDQGMLTEDSDLRRYAQLLLYLGLPYRSARALQEGMQKGVLKPNLEAYEALGNSWIAAREYERAVDPLTRAAEMSEDGRLFVRLARVYIQREKWGEAAEALRKGLERGGLDNPGDAKLLMGIALYSQGSPQKARSWFAQAGQHQSTRQEANAWLAHIDQEIRDSS